MVAMKVRNPVDGTWVVVPTVGPVGPEGPIGPQGPMGISTVIVGNFGTQTTPADLPVDGLLPVDWDGPGDPAAPFQMEVGQSLYYDSATGPTDPIDGHLFQFVSTAVDPTGWIDIGLIQGPQGEQGIQGPEGPVGPEGPMGPADDEVHIGPDTPPLVTQELWFDTDDARLLGPYNLPDGGLTYHTLSKKTDLDGDIEWRDVYSVPTGKVIQFPNTADVAKIHLYSTTFGFGITGSTLNIFSSNYVKFNQNSITGTQNAVIKNDGMEINAGHLYFPTDGHGIRFNGNGYVYKKSGSGMKLRKSTGNPQWQVENNDGGGAVDILTDAAWVSVTKGGGLSGNVYYKHVGPTMTAVKFSINKQGAQVGNGQHVADFPAPSYACGFCGSNKEGDVVRLQMTALGQLYVREHGDSLDVFGTFVYTRG